MPQLLRFSRAEQCRFPRPWPWFANTRDGELACVLNDLSSASQIRWRKVVNMERTCGTISATITSKGEQDGIAEDGIHTAACKTGFDVLWFDVLWNAEAP